MLFFYALFYSKITLSLVQNFLRDFFIRKNSHFGDALRYFAANTQMKSKYDRFKNNRSKFVSFAVKHACLKVEESEYNFPMFIYYIFVHLSE